MIHLLGRLASAGRRGASAVTGFIACTMAWPAAAAPAYVDRSLHMLQAMPPLARHVLLGSVLLLLVAIPLKILEARRNATPRFEGRDLRWWLNPEWRAAVYD